MSPIKKAALSLCTFAFVLGVCHEARAAAVGPGGFSTEFTAAPDAADWAGKGISGLVADITTSNDLESAVQLLAASVFSAPLASSSSNPPSASAAGFYCDAGYLQTRPNNVSLTALLATFRNTTGSNVTSVKVSYRFTTNLLSSEQLPGQLVFYSLSGNAGSWVVIPPFSIARSGNLSATLNIAWDDSMPLFLMFADDNGPGTDTSCEIDSFAITTSGGLRATPFVLLTNLVEGVSIVQGANFLVSAVASSAIGTVSFYDGITWMGTDASYPFSMIYSNLSPGVHAIHATGNGTVASSIVHVNIVSNHPPAVALSTMPGGVVLVGSNIVNTAFVTDNDPGGSIQRVEFYLDGALKFADTTTPYTYDYSDATVGPHVIEAVAVDQSGARGSNRNTLIATNPAGIVVLIPNGDAWKYFDQGTDQGSAWRQLAFDDSGWSNGIAEFGYGDGEGRRPEVTVIGFGTNSAAKYPTTYFRKTFHVSNPAVYQNLIVRLMRDDGGIVYLNGTEVFRSYMTNGAVNYATLAGPAATGPQVEDDGTFYQVTNTTPAVLIAGLNIAAVEIHQEDPDSSDISFDMMLWGTLPVLSVTRANPGQVTLSWPLSPAGYVLQSSSVIAGPVWSTVAESDFPDATEHHVVVNTPGTQRFFRLQHP